MNRSQFCWLLGKLVVVVVIVVIVVGCRWLATGYWLLATPGLRNLQGKDYWLLVTATEHCFWLLASGGWQPRVF